MKVQQASWYEMLKNKNKEKVSDIWSGDSFVQHYVLKQGLGKDSVSSFESDARIIALLTPKWDENREESHLRSTITIKLHDELHF